VLIKDCYTYKQAQDFVQAQGIKRMKAYAQACVSDPRLPRHPDKTYASKAFGAIWKDWRVFFGTEIYGTYTQAQQAVKALKIRSQREYERLHGEDSRLPAAPHIIYSKSGAWQGWNVFLGTEYCTYKQARKAVQAGKIETEEAYHDQHEYLSQLNLPPHPDTFYENWRGWNIFLDICTHQEAQVKVKALGINSEMDYGKRHCEDERLPVSPKTSYAEFSTWNLFLDVGFYGSYEEAQAAAQAAGFKTEAEYRKGYQLDPRLCRYPGIIYKCIAFSWPDFLTPTLADSYVKARTLVRLACIKSPKEYQSRYSSIHKSLVLHPDRKFEKDGWISWHDFLGTSPKDYCTYAEAIELMQAEGINTYLAYGKYRMANSDARLYAKPKEHYKEWTTWADFLVKSKPFQPNYISTDYRDWQDAIKRFIKITKKGKAKTITLCKFQRLYIEANELGKSPAEFLVNPQNVDKALLDRFLEDVCKTIEKTKKTVITEIGEFFDHFIRTDWIELDEDADEIDKSDLLGPLKNPFSTIFVEEERRAKPSETVKPRLEYIYIKEAREWIIPDTAQTFDDLKHLYEIYEDSDADWTEVDEAKINKDDPNCIYKCKTIKKQKKYYIWSPVNWVHTYVLMHLPQRGIQIAYNDSGEGDREIPDINAEGKIYWKQNETPLAGQTKNQGMLRKYPNNELGYFNTTNKTSHDFSGHSVPWINDRVAYWLIMLRNWQSTYNPLTAVTPWVQCINTNLNAAQLKRKGVNCFLFRGYGAVEPIKFQNALAIRIAAALYNIQDQHPGIVLATCKSGKTTSLAHYETLFTPHCMRVGLISAFLFDFGLPVEIVIKIVGHSSIVMLVYYAKVSSGELRQKMADGEAKALKNPEYAHLRQIEQQKKDELINQTDENQWLITKNSQAGTFTFSDIGICPFAGSRCDEGGEELNNSKHYHPVAVGYLGKQNCLRCRFFVTGPAYVGGLLSLYNDVSAKADGHAADDLAIVKEIRNFNEQSHEVDIKQLNNEDLKVVSQCETARSSFDCAIMACGEKRKGIKTNLDIAVGDLLCIQSLLTQALAALDAQIATNGAEPIILLQQSALNLDAHSGLNIQLAAVLAKADSTDLVNTGHTLEQRKLMLDSINQKLTIKPILTDKQQLTVAQQMMKLMLARLMVDSVPDFSESKSFSKVLESHTGSISI
jgi:hypothetical protein